MKSQSHEPRHFYFIFIPIILAMIFVLGTIQVHTEAQRPSDTKEPPKIPEVVFGGGLPQPLSVDATIYEGFESGLMPPTGWDLLYTNPLLTWRNETDTPHSGVRHAAVGGDTPGGQDEVLFSPPFTGTSGTLEFWSFGSLYFCRDGEKDNCDLEIYYVQGTWDGGSGDDVLLGLADEDWTADWAWSLSSFDLSTYTDGTEARIAFRYVGSDGAKVGLDDVSINIMGEMNEVVYLPLILKDYPPPEQPDWTFMVYLSGDGEQETAALDTFLDIAAAGSSADVNILTQLDRHPENDARFDDWSGVKRFLVGNGMEPTSTNALQDLGEVNMGDDAALVDFVSWGMATYPADHYALVLWDPEKGIRTDSDGLLDGLVYDATSSGDTLDMVEIQDALDTLTQGGADPLDLLGLDAGLSAMMEVDAQVSLYVDLRVSSQDLAASSGWPYDTVLSDLVADPTQAPADFASDIVDRYYIANGEDLTQSAVDLGSPYATLVSEVDQFAAALIAGVETHYAGIQTARANSQEFANPDHIDLYDFVDRVAQQLPATDIYTAAVDVMDAISSTLLNEQHGAAWTGAYGIGIYYPESLIDYNPSYDGSANKLDFTQNTSWDEWLQEFFYQSRADVIINGDFELGRGVGWNESSTNGYELVTQDLDGSVLPHGGDWAAWLGGGDQPEVSIISQSINIPAVENQLVFWYFLYAEETCPEGTDVARILVDSNVEWEKKLCVDNSYWGWLFEVIDLSGYIGDDVNLEIEATVIGSESSQNEIFIDDVYLIP